MKKFIDTQKENKIISTIWAFIFCIFYIVIMNKEKQLFTIAAPFHLCLLFTTIIFTGSLATLYDWVNKELFILYHCFVHFTMLLIGILSLKTMLNHPQGYYGFFTEVAAVAELLMYGIVVGAAITFPFKVLQMYYYGTELYAEVKDTPNIMKQLNNTQKEDLELETKNETELSVLLSTYIKEEKFEKASKVRDIIQRKFK